MHTHTHTHDDESYTHEEYLAELERSYRAHDQALDSMLLVSPASLLLDSGYDYVGFVSSSKGRGRKRPAPVEVELWKGAAGWRQLPRDGCGPFDCMATETFKDLVDEASGEQAVLAGLRAIPEVKQLRTRSSLFFSRKIADFSSNEGPDSICQEREVA